MMDAQTVDGGVLARGRHGWQLILADLAMILFLMTLTALPDREVPAKSPPAAPAPLPATRAEIAASQALYRAVPGGPSLSEWLAAQGNDPRATLTVFARHAPGGEAAAWQAAQQLSRSAADSGVPVRTVIMAGDRADIYASLAYDEPPARARERE